jgi:hypothetical protein
MTAFDPLTRRSRPRFGLLAVAVSLACAASLAAYFLTHQPHGSPHGPRQSPVTVLSWLPDAVLLNPSVQVAAGAVFYLAAALWLAQRLIPYSAIIAAAAFTAVVALHAENATQLTHVAHLTNVVLIVLALWYGLCARELRAARRERRLLTSLVEPRWVHALGVLAVGLFYGYSGWTKLLTCGPGWANGVSMQLWVSLWGDPGSPWTRLILTDRRFAAFLQASALAGECAALPAAFLPRLRPWVGLGLLGFHYGQISVFGWGFHANAVLIALFFLPCDRWVQRLAEWAPRRAVRRARTGADVPVTAPPTAPA